jgi:hypothetical protein
MHRSRTRFDRSGPTSSSSSAASQGGPQTAFTIKRLKELEAENARLRRAVADLTLDKLILKEAASGNY